MGSREFVAEFGKRKWKKKDGTEVRFSKMDDNHILNAANMLERNAEMRLERISRAMDMIHGEFALDAATAAADDVEYRLAISIRRAANMRKYVTFRSLHNGGTHGT